VGKIVSRIIPHAISRHRDITSAITIIFYCFVNTLRIVTKDEFLSAIFVLVESEKQKSTGAYEAVDI
jgi:hypothetical protein